MVVGLTMCSCFKCSTEQSSGIEARRRGARSENACQGLLVRGSNEGTCRGSLGMKLSSQRAVPYVAVPSLLALTVWWWWGGTYSGCRAARVNEAEADGRGRGAQSTYMRHCVWVLHILDLVRIRRTILYSTAVYTRRAGGGRPRGAELVSRNYDRTSTRSKGCKYLPRPRGNLVSSWPVVFFLSCSGEPPAENA